jgi:hypothetical protein
MQDSNETTLILNLTLGFKWHLVKMLIMVTLIALALGLSNLVLGVIPLICFVLFLITSLVNMATMAAWHSLKQAQSYRLPRIQTQLETNFGNTWLHCKIFGRRGNPFCGPFYSQLLHEFCQVEVLPSFPPPYMQFFFQM